MLRRDCSWGSKAGPKSGFLSSVFYSFIYIYRSFVSLGRFITKYFILFVAMVNRIVSLIPFCFLIVSV